MNNYASKRIFPKVRGENPYNLGKPLPGTLLTTPSYGHPSY